MDINLIIKANNSLILNKICPQMHNKEISSFINIHHKILFQISIKICHQEISKIQTHRLIIIKTKEINSIINKTPSKIIFKI